MSWEKTSLRDLVLDLTSGGRPKGGSIDRGIFSIGAEHLDGNGGFDLSNGKYIPLDYYNSIGKGKIKANDILLVKDGATTGKVSFVSSDFPLADAAINEHVFRIELKEDLIYPKYCFYFLVSTEGQKNIMSDFRGATVGGISKSILDKIQIPLPPLATQKRIAEILDTADALRRKDQELLKKYDELAQAIFIEMFGDPVKNEKGWETKPLKNVTTKIGSGATPTGGKTAYKSEGISLIRSMNVYDFSFKLKDLAFIDETQAARLNNVTVESKDVLFNITGASVCRCSIVPDELLPARVNQHVAIIRAKKDCLNPIFLNHLLVSDSVKTKLLGVGSGGGAVMEAITKDQLEQFEIVVPPIKLQDKFEELINNTFIQKSAEITSILRSEDMFNSLIQKAFNGELVS
jgi:type I restriction enzyme S subunit